MKHTEIKYNINEIDNETLHKLKNYQREFFVEEFNGYTVRVKYVRYVPLGKITLIPTLGIDSNKIEIDLECNPSIKYFDDSLAIFKKEFENAKTILIVAGYEIQ